LKNPVPEILAGHELRAITGVFGVLFQLLGNFLKMIIQIIQINLIIRVTKKIFSATEKNHKNPKYPVFTIRPGAAAAPHHYVMFSF
jgi:hypothetical protein